MSSLSVTVVMNFAKLIMTFNFSINSADLQFYFMVCSARCKKNWIISLEDFPDIFNQENCGLMFERGFKLHLKS